jgi:hypothetical protein
VLPIQTSRLGAVVNALDSELGDGRMVNVLLPDEG